MILQQIFINLVLKNEDIDEIIEKNKDKAAAKAAKRKEKEGIYREKVLEASKVNAKNISSNSGMSAAEKEEKVRLIEDIFKGRIGDELVGLLRMLVQKGHYKETDQVFTYFIDRVKEYKKIGTAYVTSAMELTPQQKQAVEQKLLDTTKYVQFEIHYTTDPALIGGMVIRIRDRVVDGSVRTRLEHLTRDLERIQLKVGECAP